ncbi:uncharacterized protein LOC109852100 [Pseudomyrmex gracilis]|uniref:uncharacterized protein LOC109852100 n=1 Tax=Pseudomyrmex gracilis TaxID=219809 RepID=UPI000995035C|nr:uncharacterized protein LOC109852100 [Pseudomyrmex gracilis]
MALRMRSKDLRQVPWLSPEEWHNVYKQIYSNNSVEQTKAYETLLAWKARMPKLPVGVECTLLILQVCLRDREWSPKIDNGELPMYSENDLSLIYSTTIMRFFNHITNIEYIKHTSLLKVAKLVKLPTWIINIRHQAAHGHELPSIAVLRIAINILLHWLHNEYWAPEARAMEERCMTNFDVLEDEEHLRKRTFARLIELWITVGLYIKAGHELVSDLPVKEIREELEELRIYMLHQYKHTKTSNNNEDVCVVIDRKTIKIGNQYSLKSARALLLANISVQLTDETLFNLQKQISVICNMLCEIKAFLLNFDIVEIVEQKTRNSIIDLKRKFLSPKVLQFWKSIILLLHRVRALETLMLKLLDIVNQEEESKERRNFAALWLSSIVYSFVQLNIAHNISHTLEFKSDVELSIMNINERLRKLVHSKHAYLRHVLWLDITSTVPRFLVDIDFLSNLLLHVNEFSARLIEPILMLVATRIDKKTRGQLLNLVKIYTFQKYKDESNDVCDKIFTIEDLSETSIESEARINKEQPKQIVLADQIIRNSQWKLALDTYQWNKCPIGLLPWQDSLKSLEPFDLKPTKHPVSVLESQIVPGIINPKKLKIESSIKQDNILRNKKRKISCKNIAIGNIMNSALEFAKNTNNINV